jgi:hypothetical protein
MAVAYDQLDEVLRVLQRRLPGAHGDASVDAVIQLLEDLSRTKAYRRNASFRVTIDRLLSHARNAL